MADSREAVAVGRLTAANRQICSQSNASLRRSRAEARIRQKRAMLDDLIAVLEERTLDGERRVDRMVRGRVRRLEAEFGVPVPRRVLRARSTARLHGALLDWIEVSIADLIPERRLQADGTAADTQLARSPLQMRR